MRKNLLIVLSISLALVLTACGVSNRDYQAKDPNNTTGIVLEIPAGSTTKSIGKLLEAQGVILNENAFISTVKKLSAANELKAGKYQFNQSMSVEEIVQMIAKGQVYADRAKVVIPEGYEVRQIVDRLEKAGLIDRAVFENELINGKFDYPFITSLDRSTKLEGYLFPATYQFDKGISEHDIIDQMLKTFDHAFDQAYYEKAKSLNMSVEEVITLASIIEREAMVPEERPIVSSVFHNRLDKPMRLQSCATVQYILGERKEVLSIKDTQIKSPYNTYRIDGLPPAPIASPGKAAIEAALNPAQTDYLYFVTTNNGDGSHYFSRTLEEHNAAILKSKK